VRPFRARYIRLHATQGVALGSLPPAPSAPDLDAQTNDKLFRTVAIRIDDFDRQIVVRLSEFPPAIFSAFHGCLVWEQLLFHFATVLG